MPCKEEPCGRPSTNALALNKKDPNDCENPIKAAEQAIRRMCKRDRNGKRKISDLVCDKFLAGGDGRQELISIFLRLRGSHESQPLNLYNMNKN